MLGGGGAKCALISIFFTLKFQALDVWVGVYVRLMASDRITLFLTSVTQFYLSLPIRSALFYIQICTSCTELNENFCLFFSSHFYLRDQFMTFAKNGKERMGLARRMTVLFYVFLCHEHSSL